MIGDSRKGRPTYYLCWPRKNAAGRFFADRSFGPDRTSILEADLTTVDDTAAQARAEDGAEAELQRAGSKQEHCSSRSGSTGRTRQRNSSTTHVIGPEPPGRCSLLAGQLGEGSTDSASSALWVTQLTVPTDQMTAIAKAGEMITDAMSATEIAKKRRSR